MGQDHFGARKRGKKRVRSLLRQCIQKYSFLWNVSVPRNCNGLHANFYGMKEISPWTRFSVSICSPLFSESILLWAVLRCLRIACQQDLESGRFKEVSNERPLLRRIPESTKFR